MSLSGVNGANPNEEPKRINGTDEQNGQEVKKESEQPCSVWDINKDGTVSVEEQKIAIQNAIDTDETIKEAVELGFVPQYGLSDIVTNKPMFGETVEYLVDRADNLVKQYINNIKLDAGFFISQINMKNFLESMKEMFGNQPAEAKDTVPKLNSIEEYDQKQKELSSHIKPQAENLDDLENAAKWKQKQIDLANEYGDTVGAEALQADLDRIKQDIERNTSR